MHHSEMNDTSILFKQFKKEIENVLCQEKKDYSQANETFTILFRKLMESPENNQLIIEQLYDFCRHNQVEVLAINFPSCPSKKDGSNVKTHELYDQNFLDAIDELRDLLNLKTLDNHSAKIDLNILKTDRSYLNVLKEMNSLNSDSLKKIERLELVEDLSKKLDYIMNFDVDVLYLFKGLNEQVQIAKMKKELFAQKGLTIDTASSELLQLDPKMAALITRVTMLCHWGTRGVERLIFANTAENIDTLSDLLKDEQQFANLKRLTILGCSTTKRVIPEPTTARLLILNGEINNDVITNLNNQINLNEPSYLLNYTVNDNTNSVQINLFKLPYYADQKHVLLSKELDARELYKKIYAALPEKARRQALKPDAEMNRIIGFLKNALNTLSKKNMINIFTILPTQMNPALKELELSQVHKIIFEDCGRKTVNDEVNLHVFEQKKGSALLQRDVLKSNQEMIKRYQTGSMLKSERQAFKGLFLAMKKASVELTGEAIISNETYDLSRLAEARINSQRINSPIEVKGYTIPVTKAKEGNYMIGIGNEKVIAEILEENIPKSITFKRKI